MIQYEYTVIQSNLVEDLNTMGKQGWMVCSYDYNKVLLMRPIVTAI